MLLSPHFTLAECTKSMTATRLGIANEPDESAHHNMSLTALNILEPIRVHYGTPFTPNSFFRCLELNRALRSEDTSQHVIGQAVDKEVPGVPNIDLALWVKNNLMFDQLILEFYDRKDPTAGWVHTSYSEAHNRGLIATISKEDGYVEGLPFV